MTLDRDECDFFAPPIAQPTFYGEGVCKPGWIGALPEKPAAPLYEANAPDVRLCPVCGERVHLIGETADSRLIGSCRDAFTRVKWEEPVDYTNADADPDDLFGPEPPLRFRPVTAAPARLVFDEGLITSNDVFSFLK
jgi:hypothetical protein